MSMVRFNINYSRSECHNLELKTQHFSLNVKVYIQIFEKVSSLSARPAYMSYLGRLLCNIFHLLARYFISTTYDNQDSYIFRLGTQESSDKLYDLRWVVELRELLSVALFRSDPGYWSESKTEKNWVLQNISAAAGQPNPNFDRSCQSWQKDYLQPDIWRWLFDDGYFDNRYLTMTILTMNNI